MKKISVLANIFLASVLVFILLPVVLPNRGVQAVQASPSELMNKVSQPDCDSTRTVQVTGAALIYVTPDQVMIQLGVESNGVTTHEVEASNSTAIQAVIQAIKDQGVEAKDITTDVYVIDPVYDSSDSLYIKGYRINNIVAVNLRGVQKTSAVIAAALDAGANQVLDVEFYTSELRKYRDQARELAMKAAQEKAQALAATAGADVGCVMNINENSQSYYNGWWWYGYRNNQNLWAQNAVQTIGSENGSGSSAGDEPISLGQISVKADVSATFSLK